MAERVIPHLLRLGVRFGEDHDLDEAAIKALIRKCELARVPFSIRAGVFHVGEEALAAVRAVEAEIEDFCTSDCGPDCEDCKVVRYHEQPSEPSEDSED